MSRAPSLGSDELTNNSVTVISIARLVTLFQTNFTSDVTWNYTRLAVWSDAEPPVGLISCCLPAYGPYLRGLMRLFNKETGDTKQKDSRVRGTYGSETSCSGKEGHGRTDWKSGHILRSITYDVESTSTKGLKENMADHEIELSRI